MEIGKGLEAVWGELPGMMDQVGSWLGDVVIGKAKDGSRLTVGTSGPFSPQVEMISLPAVVEGATKKKYRVFVRNPEDEGGEERSYGVVCNGEKEALRKVVLEWLAIVMDEILADD